MHIYSKLTPLHEAAEHGNTEVLDVLLKANAEVYIFSLKPLLKI